MDENQIIKLIKQFIHQEPPTSYFIGIAQRPKIRLQAHFALDVKAMSVQADDVKSAKRIVSYFINDIGTDGGSGGGNDDSKYLYCYKKGMNTIEHI